MTDNTNEITVRELCENEGIQVGKKKNQQNRLLTIKANPILHFGFNETPKAGYGRCRSCGWAGYISKHNGSHE
jgi:hypothetical protein